MRAACHYLLLLPLFVNEALIAVHVWGRLQALPHTHLVRLGTPCPPPRHPTTHRAHAHGLFPSCTLAWLAVRGGVITNVGRTDQPRRLGRQDPP